MSYRALEIWQLSEELITEIHFMTLEDLPAFEKFEVGSQIRRSIKSVQSNIVEGYGRKFYKKQYLQFLIIAQASLDETTNHLEILWKTKSLKDRNKYESLHEKLDKTGRKLNLFIQCITKDCQ